MYAADVSHPERTLEDKLRAVYSLNREKVVDLSFRPPYLNLLEALGNPHKALPPVIHVAGTNGKGSTVAFMRAILEEAGYRVHVYTSPHLVRFNERIVLAGEEIANGQLERLLDEVIRLNGGAEATFFEVTTALAFRAFADVPADVLLLETGLGGRLDCTNIVENPLATAITSIGYDHMEFLGESIAEIAAEKAGIMKPGVPCVIGPQRERDPGRVFAEIATERGVPLSAAGTDWSVQAIPGGFCLSSESGEEELPAPALQGAHQLENAGTAIMTLRRAGISGLDTRILSAGLLKARWPGRLQTLAAPAPGWTLRLDGGHNPDASRRIAETLASEGRKVHLVVAMMNRKDPAGFLAPLLPYAQSLTWTRIPHEPASLTLEQARLDTLEIPVFDSPDPDRAILDILARNEGSSGEILATGSLYLAGYLQNRRIA